jgi:addiction module RelE/StbE family toxin
VIVRWSLLARQDLQLLRAYIARENPAAAARVARRISAATRRLGQYPYLGRTGRQAGTRELVVPRTPYVVIYVVFEDRLEIVRVLHGAQRWP